MGHGGFLGGLPGTFRQRLTGPIMANFSKKPPGPNTAGATRPIVPAYFSAFVFGCCDPPNARSVRNILRRRRERKRTPEPGLLHLLPSVQIPVDRQRERYQTEDQHC